MVIENFNDAQKLNVLVIAYEAGSSGEFLASALTSSFPCFSNTNVIIDAGRYIFLDFFYRGFMGNISITPEEIKRRINCYLTNLKTLNQWHIGLMHPNVDVQDFFSNHFPLYNTLLINSSHPVSNNFKELASCAKIPREFKKSRPIRPFKFSKKIEFDWHSCLLGTTYDKKIFFDSVSHLVNHDGNFLEFQKQCNSYVQKNRILIDQANAKYSYG